MVATPPTRTTIAACSPAVRPRARVLGAATAHAPGAPLRAVARAARLALADAALAPGAVTRVLGAATDVEAVRQLGVGAPSHHEAPGTLGAAPLIAAARWLV